jgi:Tol biopolymer transport system component
MLAMPNRGRVAMAGLIAVVFTAAGGAAAPAPARGPQGTLVFSSDRSGIFQIYSIRADGSRLGQLTRGRAADDAPLVSPDGRRIVFVRNRSQLWVMNADGSGQRKLASSGAAPSWSPDSRRLAYIGAGSKLVVARVQGRPRVVVRGGSSRPSWSPDGRLIAFSREVGDRVDLAVVRGDGRGLRTVRRNADLLGWSPRGEIAFVGKYGGAVSLIGANGRHARRLLRSVPYALAWSPDGRRLAFVDRGGLHVASSTGRSIRRLPPKGAASPAWSPDSRWLAVASEHDVLLVAVDGSSLRHLTARLPRPWGGAGYGAATWRPKGATRARLGRRPVPPLPSETVSRFSFRPGSGTISELAADGGLAAIIFRAEPCIDAGIEAWQPARRRFARLAREGCGENGSRYQPAHGLAVAGAHVAWLQVNGGNDLETSVVTATLGGSAPVHLGLETADGSDLGDIAGEPVGGDGLLVFTVSYRCDHDPYDSNCPPGRKTGDLVHGTIWRLGGRMRCGGDENGPRRCTKVAQADGELTVLAAGSGRIAARTDQGVRLLTAEGKVVRDFPVAAKAAAVSGNRLAVRVADAVEVYDTGSGRRTDRFPVPKAVSLQDLEGDILVTVSGTTATLRKLGNGRTATYQTAGPAKAALEAPGLYVAGAHRVTFTPMREVLRRLGS